MAFSQPFTRGDLVPADFVVARFDLNRYDPSLVLRSHPRKDVAVVDLLSSSGKLFLREPGLAHVASIRHSDLRYSPSARIGNSSAWRRSPAAMATG